MKHKTAELEGDKLDIAVAKALGLTSNTRSGRTGLPTFMVPNFIDCPSRDEKFGDDFEPSERWDHGGPIIERERINVGCSVKGPWRGIARDKSTGRTWYADASTPLVAGMRAFVLSKLGEEVDL